MYLPVQPPNYLIKPHCLRQPIVCKLSLQRPCTIYSDTHGMQAFSISLLSLLLAPSLLCVFWSYLVNRKLQGTMQSRTWGMWRREGHPVFTVMDMECKSCCNCYYFHHNLCYVSPCGGLGVICSLWLWCVTRSDQHSLLSLPRSPQRPRLRLVSVVPPGSVVLRLTVSQGRAGVQQRERCLVQTCWEAAQECTT